MFISIIINLLITATLLLLSFWSGDYARRWWLRFKRVEFIKKSFYDSLVFLEVKLPREINKSPKAMEFALDAFIQEVGGTTSKKLEDKKYKSVLMYFLLHALYRFEWKPIDEKDATKKRSIISITDMKSDIIEFRTFWNDKYKNGMVKLWMSLEIESRGGQLHFFIVTQKKYKGVVSSYIYSQYPGIEIIETSDYTNKIRHYKFGGEHEAYTSIFEQENYDYMPIRTYVDYELDGNPKEEYKIDPLAPLLESMAQVGPDEHVWFQLLLRSTTDAGAWKKAGDAQIDKLLGVKVTKSEDGKTETRAQDREISKLTPYEKNQIELITRKQEKIGFDTLIRMVYWAPKGGLKQENDQIIRNAMKSFNKPGYNTFKAKNQNSPQPFLDFPDMRIQTKKRSEQTIMYTMRSVFYGDLFADGEPFKEFKKKWKDFDSGTAMKYLFEGFGGYLTPKDSSEGRDEKTEKGKGEYFLLNAEEVATIYHFPGRNLTVPNLDRVNSVKSEAPTNLPI